jgi:TolB protein
VCKLPWVARLAATVICVSALAGALTLISRAGGTVPGSNGLIAFARYAANADEAIYVMRPDGSQATRITSPGFVDRGPEWSPNGKRIAFASSRGRSNRAAIWVINADGSGLRRLSHGAHEISDSPTWSPDGRWLAFNRFVRIAFYRVYALSLSTNRLRLITPRRLDAEEPDWSPDGRRMVFISTQGASEASRIYIDNVNGTGAHALELPGKRVRSNPNWSPDGHDIVFSQALTSAPDLTGSIYTVRANGTTLKQLTNPPRGVSDEDPEWSPDGTKIVFTRYGTNFQGAVYVMNADGSEVRRLSPQTANDTSPSWQRT